MYLKDIQKVVSEKTGVPEHTVSQVLLTVFDEINEQVYVHGESVQIRDFGTFKRLHVKERHGHNVRTNGPCVIPAHDRLKFIPSKNTSKIYNPS